MGTSASLLPGEQCYQGQGQSHRCSGEGHLKMSNIAQSMLSPMLPGGKAEARLLEMGLLAVFGN